MNKPLLILSAPVETRSGYGEHSRDIFASLLKMDKFDIKILSQRWGSTPRNALDLNIPLHQEIKKRIIPDGQLRKRPSVWVQVTVPNEFQKVGVYNIGITAGIETTACSPEWLTGLNNVDLVIVPSRFSKEVFENTVYDYVDEETQLKSGELKCTVPIEVIFEGADLSIYNDTKSVPTAIRYEMNNVKEDFAFLFVGHWLHGDFGHDRKDVGMLVKTFLETFKNEPVPPALILKTSHATFSVVDRDAIITKIEQIKESVHGNTNSLPNIYLLHGELTAEEMNGLYNHSKVKAHVSFTKGEGYGRPLLEASLSGKPIIASNWSGHTDFLHKDHCLLIGGEVKQVHPSAVWDKVIVPNSAWFYIDYNQAASAMFNVFKNYQGAKSMCAPQKEHAKMFSLENMHTVFKNVFDKYVPEFPSEVKLQLPKIKKIELPKKEEVPEPTPHISMSRV